MNIACRSSQNAALIKRFWRLHIVIKPFMLKRITLLILIQTLDFGACQKWEPARCMGDFDFWFFNGFANACFDRPEYWMSAICIAKFFCCEILHSSPNEVRGLYDKNSASWYYFTSDVMYKKYKRLVYTSPDLLVTASILISAPVLLF